MVLDDRVHYIPPNCHFSISPSFSFQPLFPGESGVDQLVEIIKVLGTPTREEIKCMNPNYIERIAHPWHKGVCNHWFKFMPEFEPIKSGCPWKVRLCSRCSTKDVRRLISWSMLSYNGQNKTSSLNFREY